jgi:oligosaccharide repeat unit polymerase
MLDSRNIVIICALAFAIAASALGFQLGHGTSDYAAVVLSVGGLVILAANWQAHDGGRSASFIFLVLGLTFLCGRALPILFGDESQLPVIGYGEPYEVAPAHVMKYVMVVLVSFLFVHVGSLLSNEKAPQVPDTSRDARIYRVMFFCLLPLLLYKNIYYFNYIMENGGYLAIYQGSEHLDGVGFLPRLGALLCLATFTLYFFHETDRKKSKNALIFFLIVFSSELLVGLRGKFFVTALIFFLFYKLRFGGKFSLRGLVTLLLVIISIAITVEITREQKSESIVAGSLLTGFLAQQGVSSGVSMIVLDNASYFSQNPWSYFIHQFAAPFYSQPEVPQGWFVANDISMMVMPEAYSLGFGTGSSYIAELLMLGGWAGICIGSLAIGWVLTKAKRYTHGVPAALMFWVVCGVVYYPRTMLQDPIHNLSRYALPTLFLAGFCLLWRRRKNLL